MSALPVLLLMVAALVVVGHHAFQHPKGVYLRSATGVLLVTLGWALIWLLVSPADEAGFGFFAIWVVLVALALLIGLAACVGASARHIFEGLKARCA